MSDLAKIKAHIDVTGQGTIEVNDQDLSRAVQGFTVQSRIGNIPVVTLHTLADGVDLEGEAVVQVESQAADPRRAVLAFLNSVDAERLERAVLEAMGYGENHTMAVVIDILREWASGRPSV